MERPDHLRRLASDTARIARGIGTPRDHFAAIHVGLEYDSHNDKMPYDDYRKWLISFWKELLRVLVNGGRFALNIAPTSIKDFRPIHYDMAHDLIELGFIMRTEILWYKQTMRRRTAWGSWKSPHNPHMVPSWEYVLVFCKGSWTLEGNKEDSDITAEEFIKYSDAFWAIQPGTRGRQPFLKSLYPPPEGAQNTRRESRRASCPISGRTDQAARQVL